MHPALDGPIRWHPEADKFAEGVVLRGNRGGVGRGNVRGFKVAHGTVLSGGVETTRPTASFSFHHFTANRNSLGLHAAWSP